MLIVIVPVPAAKPSGKMYFYRYKCLIMLQPGTLNFLRNLAHHNNKPWFDENRDAYDAARADFELLVAGILDALSVDEPAFKEQKAKDCVFRIFRDVRFSKDKTPYKAHFGAVFAKGGRKQLGCGYYFHLEPGGKSFAGGGIWEPETTVLKAIRQEIDYNFPEFEAIVAEKKFKKLFGSIQGEQLKKLPQGYLPENPAAEYLKLKSFTVGHPVPDEALTEKKLQSEILDAFKTMKPFIGFLSKSIS